MPLMIAALLLGATPPTDDDDAPRRPPVTAPAGTQGRAQAPAAAPDADDDDAKKPAAAGVAPKPDDDDEDRAQPASAIVVTARRLDVARTQIDAALGSSVYALTNDTIENRPGGETGSVADILTQAPGVTLSSQGLTIRGSAANQVRINNVIVPEAISDPADLLSSRLAETTRLITGTLPAQYGFAPAGVISVTTKNGLYEHGGQAEFFAGSGGMIEPAFEWAGSAAATSLFASGDFERGRSTIADADGITAHDRRTEFGGLGFADHVIDDSDRISLIFGGSRQRQEIGATTIGPGTEQNSDGYAVGTFQHSDNGFTVQASFFAGIATDRSSFDVSTHGRRSSVGTQIDASDTIAPSHTLRFGLLAMRSTAQELDLAQDRTNSARTSVALYAQDEWKLAPSLTFNPGARVEWLGGRNNGATVEPRASLVWASEGGLTAHIGYSRYESAPPLGEQAAADLPNERDDYVDAGVQQKLGSFTLGADAYARFAHDYIAIHQTPGSAVSRAFTFSRARIRGVELSATYAQHGTSAWANLSLESASARGIIGGNTLFAPATIAAASAHDVPLGSERPLVFSGGVSQHVGKFDFTGDLLASSGAVRTTAFDDPNGSRRSPYALLGLAALYHARIAGQPADLRLDLTNLTNVHYATIDATALEGGWTQLGRGRAITIGIEQGF